MAVVMRGRNASGLVPFPTMKPIIFIILVVLTFLIVNTPEAHAMFGHTAEERRRRVAVEQQLFQEEQRLGEQQHLTIEQQLRASRWQTTASVLGVVAVLMLVAGTAIGSNGRHHAARGE